jgi:Leucine-rich repeat (LRR) protein
MPNTALSTPKDPTLQTVEDLITKTDPTTWREVYIRKPSSHLCVHIFAITIPFQDRQLTLQSTWDAISEEVPGTLLCNSFRHFSGVSYQLQPPPQRLTACPVELWDLAEKRLRPVKQAWQDRAKNFLADLAINPLSVDWRRVDLDHYAGESGHFQVDLTRKGRGLEIRSWDIEIRPYIVELDAWEEASGRVVKRIFKTIEANFGKNPPPATRPQDAMVAIETAELCGEGAAPKIPDDRIKTPYGMVVSTEDYFALCKLVGAAKHVLDDCINEVDQHGRVVSLGFFENSLNDLTSLSRLTQLEDLHLYSCRTTDLSPLAGLTQLKRLRLIRNGIVNLAPLAGLTELNDLILNGNRIVDLGPLAGMKQLEVLWLNLNEIRDLAPLAHLTELRELYLCGNQITDLAPLRGLTKLQKLDLERNQVSDLSPLAGLERAEELYLHSNQITDLAPLAGLRQLQTLWLHYNRICSIDALAQLTQLRDLFLDRYGIASLASLAVLPQLQRLLLIGSPIPEFVRSITSGSRGQPAGSGRMLDAESRALIRRMRNSGVEINFPWFY